MVSLKKPKSVRLVSTKALNGAALAVALFGLAFLINNVWLFRDAVNQYVTQGYPLADVVRGLLPGQLIPGVFEPIAIYGGIAMLLRGAASINYRLTAALPLPVPADTEAAVDSESPAEDFGWMEDLVKSQPSAAADDNPGQAGDTADDQTASQTEQQPEQPL